MEPVHEYTFADPAHNSFAFLNAPIDSLMYQHFRQGQMDSYLSGLPSVWSSAASEIDHAGAMSSIDFGSPFLSPPSAGLSIAQQMALAELNEQLLFGGDDHGPEVLHDGETSVNSDAFFQPIEELKHAVIGVEATAYLQQMISEPPAHEPLLAALGGDPIGLRHHIQNDLDKWKEHSMRPYFVFEGQSVVGKNEMAMRQAKAALSKTQRAWELYGDNHPEEAVKAFGASGAVRPQELYRILIDVLEERGLNYLIAPFNACAQLAYLDTCDAQYIDGVMGSKELLLYGIHDAFMNPPTTADWEKKAFTGISKSALIKTLHCSPEMLDDALLMVGTSFLPPFPPLQVDNIISLQPYSITDAINLLRTSEKSMTNTCVAFQDILDKQDPNWLDKYRRAKMGVKHCIYQDASGNIVIRDEKNLTNDNNLYLGLQLPAEMYHYLSRCLIGPRIMNCFDHLEWVVFPTLDGVVSDEYKALVTRSLTPLREITVALIATRIHRGMQHREINMRFWFDESQKQTLVHRNLIDIHHKSDAWGGKDAVLKPRASDIKCEPGTISFAVLALQDKPFSSKTITNTNSKDKENLLETKSEISSNALWRLLHLRGYVNDQHELTSWGRALATTLKAISPMLKTHKDVHHLEEGAFLAFELIRFDNLNSKNRHAELIGGPLRGSDEDRSNCMLIGRTSCLLKLRHENIGYTGPLSKNFLSFHSIIKAVRETDRDLLEGILAGMLLNGHQAARPMDTLDGLGRSLPFGTDVDTSLGIAVKTYLDDFLKVDWTAEERQNNKSDYVQKYLPHSVNFAEDLDVAFNFFEAVCEGVKTLGDEMGDSDKKAWDSAKTYLAKRR